VVQSVPVCPANLIPTDQLVLQHPSIGGRGTNTALEHLNQSMWRWQSRLASWGRHILRDRPPIATGDVVLMSNDYLALARHPALIEAQIQALSEHGVGAMMSGVYVSGSDPQRDLEAALAEFLGAQTTILCQSGWDANVGLLTTLLADAPFDFPVYIDALAHASLWTGAGITYRTVHPVRHNDVDHLGDLIRRYGPGIVCVDTIYSVTGDRAPLADIVDVCERSDCCLIADESHALGVDGPCGSGIAVEYGLQSRIAFRTASLAKVFCGRAGLIVTQRDFADYFPYHSPNAVFSSTLLPHDVAGLHAALEVIRVADDRRIRLHAIARRLHAGLQAIGCSTRPSLSQIIPLQCGTEANLAAVQWVFDNRGVFGSPFLAPAIPPDQAILRLSAHAALTDADIDRVLEASAAATCLLASGSRGPH
jgi:CAI-1 autoinducer synthase